ncbi:hypothetical protein ABW19_dt0200580 [Dactylella cylindrospora]|nr:hypothetical protein ABW19_dt0200580 [Dactylella cylindrospora]
MPCAALTIPNRTYHTLPEYPNFTDVDGQPYTVEYRTEIMKLMVSGFRTFTAKRLKALGYQGEAEMRVFAQRMQNRENIWRRRHRKNGVPSWWGGTWNVDR